MADKKNKKEKAKKYNLQEFTQLISPSSKTASWADSSEDIEEERYDAGGGDGGREADKGGYDARDDRHDDRRGDRYEDRGGNRYEERGGNRYEDRGGNRYDDRDRGEGGRGGYDRDNNRDRYDSNRGGYDRDRDREYGGGRGGYGGRRGGGGGYRDRDDDFRRRGGDRDRERDRPREPREPREREPREQKPVPDHPPFTAFVGNLSFSLREPQLEEYFSDECKVKSVRIVKQDDNRSKGFGYVEFEDADSLRSALKRDGHDFEGRSLRIDVADEKPRQESRADHSDKWERGKSIPDEKKSDDRWAGGGRSGDGRRGGGGGRGGGRGYPDRDREPPSERKKLVIQPRSSSGSTSNESESDSGGPAKPNPFGSAKPRDENAHLKKVEEKMKQQEDEFRKKLEDEKAKDEDKGVPSNRGGNQRGRGGGRGGNSGNRGDRGDRDRDNRGNRDDRRRNNNQRGGGGGGGGEKYNKEKEISPPDSASFTEKNPFDALNQEE